MLSACPLEPATFSLPSSPLVSVLSDLYEFIPLYKSEMQE